MITSSAVLLIIPFSLCITRVFDSEPFPSHELWCRTGVWSCVNWWNGSWMCPDPLSFKSASWSWPEDRLSGPPAVKAALLHRTWFNWSLTHHHHHFEALNMQDRSSLASLDLIRGEWLCMCITWGCMLEQKAVGMRRSRLWCWGKAVKRASWEPQSCVLRTRCHRCTCEAPLTHASPDWPSGAWEHFPEARPVNWAAGQRCLLKTCERALQLQHTQARTGKLHADMCSEDTCNLRPVELSPGSCHRERRRKEMQMTSKCPETETMTTNTFSSRTAH